MVLSVIFGEEEQPAPPPPPPPPPTKGEKLKAAFRRRQTATKNYFSGIGKSKGSRSGGDSSVDSSVDPYDEFEVLPTQDPSPQTQSQGYQPGDIDYWNTMSHHPNRTVYKDGTMKSTYSKKTATFRDHPVDKTNTVRAETLGDRGATVASQYQEHGTLGRQHSAETEWGYLDTTKGNLKNRTFGGKPGASSPARSPRPSHVTPDSDEALYDDRASLQTNRIHFAARSTEEQRRLLEQEARERARHAARRRRKPLAESLVAGAARCSKAVLGVFSRARISVCYMCGFCDNSAV